MLGMNLYPEDTSGGGGDSGDGGLWGAVGSAVLGGLLNYKGQSDTNDKNLQLGREQMQFQERMSSTAYQRAIADMQKAGINPMLASQVGGASSPTGALPQVQNALGAAVSGAQQGASMVQAYQQIAQSKAQTDNINAQSDKIRSETMARDLNTAVLEQQLRNARMTGKKTEEEIPGISAESYRKWHEAGYQGPDKSDETPLSASGFAADVRRRRAEALAAELQLPGYKAQSEFYKSDMGVNNPYIRQALEIMKGITSATRAAK